MTIYDTSELLSITIHLQEWMLHNSYMEEDAIFLIVL